MLVVHENTSVVFSGSIPAPPLLIGAISIYFLTGKKGGKSKSNSTKIDGHVSMAMTVNDNNEKWLFFIPKLTVLSILAQPYIIPPRSPFCKIANRSNIILVLRDGGLLGSVFLFLKQFIAVNFHYNIIFLFFSPYETDQEEYSEKIGKRKYRDSCHPLLFD